MWKLVLGKYVKELINAILAGFLIALGAIVYISCVSQGHKVLGSILFASGLLIILLYGYSLITGKMGYILENKPIYILDCIVSWIGNFIGTFIFAWLFSLTRFMDTTLPSISDAFNNTLNTVVQDKMLDGVLSLLILGFFCGITIYLAVNTFKKAEQPIAKYLLVIFYISLFIFCGFEHCVADMTYFTLYAMTHKFQDYGTMIVKILYVSLGNLVGCMFIPAIVLLRRKVKTI